MRMGGLKEGRKVLILVSEGYGSGGNVAQELKEIGDLASRNNTAIYPVSPRLYRTRLRLDAARLDGRHESPRRA